MPDTNYQQSRWSLEDLFPKDKPAKLEAAFKQIENEVAEFEKLRAKLTDKISSADFLDIIKKLEAAEKLGYRLYGFASLWFSESTQDQAAQALNAQVEDFLAGMNNRTIFFNLWWKALPDEEAERLLKDAGDYIYWLQVMRQFKPHTLSEAEEKVVNTKNVTGVGALNNLYTSMTNRYTFKVEVEGEAKELTRGELMALVRTADPDMRARAYQELYRVYGDDGPILGQMYQTIVRDWRNEQVGMRKFESPISARNLINDIPDAVVNTLLDVAEENSGVFQRFFQLKARWIKVPKLRRYDIYAPVVKSDKKYEFSQAAGMVFEAFNEFDPRLAELAERVFKEKHLDAEVRKGKQGGAFCATITPDLTPWVLLNYQGKADDVATMAHELGHAIHAMMADHHSLYTQHACLPLAETASTFGEMMLVDKLLREESDESVKRDILFRQVDDAYATIQRQSFFALFERKAHQMVIDGAQVDEMAAAYLDNLHSQFGKAVDLSDEFKWEWVSIPHIYNVPFYVYAYAFGQLLVLSLYKQYKEEGESFKPKFIKILSTGGSQAPVAMLRDAGVDISTSAFWQGGFNVVSDLVKQLEAIPMP